MADRKKRCTGSPRTDAVTEFLSAQEATAALQSECLWLLLTYESIRLRDEGLQVDGTQPQAPDTLDDQGILTTTSSAADDEADSHTMHDDAAFISPPSVALAFKGASWDCLGDAMKSLSCGKTFYFDSRGDLVLKVGEAFHEGGRDFVVCSRTVARWSKVFNAMFFGGFAESISSARDEDCDDLFLGRIIRRIREMGLEEFVLPHAIFSSYLGSIHDLSDLILLEEVNGHVEGHDSSDHWIIVQIEVEEMVDNLSSPVTETHLEYLRNQAKKTGV
ncbi:hypothetical protein K4K56_008961 [Colletotrichum sp. SAR 10_98]|nr:hypothetical protein K4K56_008961 [Colletotrichum sp. SAR 10_98]